MLIPRLCAVAVMAAVLAGCAGQQVRFDGFRDANAPAAQPTYTFAIAPNSDAPNPILDKEVRKRLTDAFAGTGNTVTTAPNAAYVLRYSLGATPPREETTYANRFASAREPDMAYTTADGRVLRHHGLYAQPSMVPETRTVFDHVLNLRLEKTGPAGAAPQVVWIGRAATTASNDDLRATLDALIQASVQHFGQDTGRQLQLTIKPRK